MPSTHAKHGRRPKSAYFPFLLGPHQCIGSEFAMAEMRVVVAMVLQRFDIRLATPSPITPRASLTLRPSGRVQLHLHRRPANELPGETAVAATP